MIPRVKPFLLAVVGLCLMAHVQTKPFTKDIVTSSNSHHAKEVVGGAADAGYAAATALSASGHSLSNLDKTVDKRTPSSAVEDWSLVCQQLCGAALGGVSCSPYCKNMPVLPLKVQIENANVLMDSKRQFICPQLCGLQLGDEVCTCKNLIDEDNNSTPQTFADEINVCAIFCSYQHVALAGCSPCKQQNTITEDNDTMDNSNTPVASQNQGEVTDRVVMLSGIENSTTTSATTTTPDWNQLCAALCKTGDGGSLCNCDLSPFFV